VGSCHTGAAAASGPCAARPAPARCAPPWPVACPPWRASTATASRRGSSSATRPPTSAGPKIDYESRTLGLDRNELGAFLVQAGLGSARDHALASLLALNGLRISEALGADIDDLEYERGHRTLQIVRKGGKHAVIPLAPRTSRALDLYIGERTTGPIFVDRARGGGGCRRPPRRGPDAARSAAGGPRGHGWTATRPTAWSSAWPGGRGSPSASAPTACGTPSSPPWTPACRCGTCRRRPATPILAPRCATTEVGGRSIACHLRRRHLPGRRRALTGQHGRALPSGVTPAPAGSRAGPPFLRAPDWSSFTDSYSAARADLVSWTIVIAMVVLGAVLAVEAARLRR
jgi:hypothetical protein